MIRSVGHCHVISIRSLWLLVCTHSIEEDWTRAEKSSRGRGGRAPWECRIDDDCQSKDSEGEVTFPRLYVETGVALGCDWIVIRANFMYTCQRYSTYYTITTVHL